MLSRRSLFRLSLAAAAGGLFPALTASARGVGIFVRPADEDPKPLEKGELEVAAAGTSLPVEEVLGPNSPLVLFLIFDLTESIANADRAKTALVDILKAVPPNVYVSILRSQDGLTVLLDPSNDREKLAEAVMGVPVSGKAGLLSTIETAQQIASKVARKAAVRVATLYVTDSDIRNYREDFVNPVINSSDSRDMSRRFPEELVQEKVNRLSAKLQAYQTPLFVVHLDYASDRLNEAYQAGLLRLSEASGGHAWLCRSRVQIPESLQAAFNAIRTVHRLELQRSPRVPEQGQLEIRNGGRVLRYRAQYEWKGD